MDMRKTKWDGRKFSIWDRLNNGSLLADEGLGCPNCHQWPWGKMDKYSGARSCMVNHEKRKRLNPTRLNMWSRAKKIKNKKGAMHFSHRKIQVLELDLIKMRCGNGWTKIYWGWLGFWFDSPQTQFVFLNSNIEIMLCNSQSPDDLQAWRKKRSKTIGRLWVWIRSMRWTIPYATPCPKRKKRKRKKTRWFTSTGSLYPPRPPKQ